MYVLQPLAHLNTAGIYIEDGNEMYNKINYNVITCPFPFSDNALHGCTIPGTSNRIADTSDNQSGIFTRAATNSLTGNRSSNNFNGMLLKEGSIGRGESYGQVCESAAKIARLSYYIFVKYLFLFNMLSPYYLSDSDFLIQLLSLLLLAAPSQRGGYRKSVI